MLNQIITPEDVIAFARHLVNNEGINIHPDDDFRNYINLETQKLTYSKEEADLRNELMNQCFTVCAAHGMDVYDTVSEIFLKETGLNELIPLPSSPFV